MSDNDTFDDVYKVVFTLVNVSKEVREDSEARRLVELVKNEILKEPSPAQKFLAGVQPSTEDVEEIQKQVLKYLRVKDKYTGLGSMLLKSQAFHLIHAQPSTTFQDYTIVDLPRTKYRKPYIPILDFDGSKSSMRQEDLFPLSISHQFPFVGSAMHKARNCSSTDSKPKIGLDIVVFDDYNRKLYSSMGEFLEAFRESFTKREWTLISNCEESFRLNEFYCRWAIKEAYTKALGLGLGFEFNTFDLQLSALGDSDVDSRLWPSLSANPGGSYLRGSISFLRTSKPPEIWDFFFLPLFDDWKDQSDSNIVTKGCACVCIGPLPSPLPISPVQVEVKRIGLSDLISWHHQTNSIL